MSLTDDQKTKLMALQDSDKKPEGDDKEKRREYQKEIRAKVSEILTKEQMDKLKDLMPKRGDKTQAPPPPAKDEPKDNTGK